MNRGYVRIRNEVYWRSALRVGVFIEKFSVKSVLRAGVFIEKLSRGCLPPPSLRATPLRIRLLIREASPSQQQRKIFLLRNPLRPQDGSISATPLIPVFDRLAARGASRTASHCVVGARCSDLTHGGRYDRSHLELAHTAMGTAVKKPARLVSTSSECDRGKWFSRQSTFLKEKNHV